MEKKAKIVGMVRRGYLYTQSSIDHKQWNDTTYTTLTALDDIALREAISLVYLNSDSGNGLAIERTNVKKEKGTQVQVLEWVTLSFSR